MDSIISTSYYFINYKLLSFFNRLILRVFLICFLFIVTKVDLLFAQSLEDSNSVETSVSVGILLVLAIILLITSKLIRNKKIEKRFGFLVITPHKVQKFYPINEEIKNMIPVVEALADEQTNVYSNLSKIILNIKDKSVFLEEKNVKISILVNRRRTRRCHLNDGDIIDMGELTVMFQSPTSQPIKNEQKQNTIRNFLTRGQKTSEKLLKSCPSLIPLDSRKKTFFITKNITFVGRSEINDLVPKSKGVELRHTRIEKVAGRFKLTDLGSTNGTFVNGRRVENRFLKDGDTIAFEAVKYTFSLSGRSR